MLDPLGIKHISAIDGSFSQAAPSFAFFHMDSSFVHVPRTEQDRDDEQDSLCNTDQFRGCEQEQFVFIRRKADNRKINAEKCTMDTID